MICHRQQGSRKAGEFIYSGFLSQGKSYFLIFRYARSPPRERAALITANPGVFSGAENPVTVFGCLSSVNRDRCVHGSVPCQDQEYRMLPRREPGDRSRCDPFYLSIDIHHCTQGAMSLWTGPRIPQSEPG